MPLLPGVFLRDLQFDGLVCVRHGAEERRGRLAYLEINRAIFDLNDDVGLELSVERMEVVGGGAGAVGFRVAPIQMMVVNEGAVQQDPVRRSESAGDDIGGIGSGASILRRPATALGIGF